MEFEIVEPEKKVEKKLTEQETNNVFMSLLLGKDVTKKVSTRRGEFVIKYLKPNDLISLGRIMAYNRNGLAVSCFDALTERRNTIISTLEVAVLDGPDWYKNVKAERSSFYWGDMPDYAFCEELYDEVCSFRNSMQESINERKQGTDRVPASESVDVTMDAGAFSGVASTH